MKKTKIVISILVALALLLTACGPEPAPASKPVSVLNNAMAGNQLSIPHEVAGEHFTFTTAYSTDYNTNEWHITDTKSLNVSATIQPDPGYEAVEVLVEHAHYDISIVSKYAMMNGVPQDSMDDSIHGGVQPGFWITPTYPYENVFAIEGYSQWLIDGWGYYTTSYGYTDITTYRLTEGNLRERGGVTGSKIQVVYDLLIKYPGETLYHTRSIIDEFVIPVGGVATTDVNPTPQQ